MSLVNKRDVKVDFLKDIATHEMVVANNDGIYRHLQFRKPQARDHWLDIVTYPGVLVINGDMGCWVFSRVEDMFTFFRREDLEINASYWSEKLQNGVSGGSSEAKEFSAEFFKEDVIGRLVNWDLTPEEMDDVKDALEDEVFTDEEDLYGQFEHYRKLYEFDYGGVRFNCEIPDGMEYKYHFLWCLYAIVWGIQRYDSWECKQL